MASASAATTSVLLERHRGDFQLEGEDGVPFTVRWRWSPSTPTKRANGITGWARVDGSEDLSRVHVCFHNPCRAVYTHISKYGNLPAPRHGRVRASASSAVAEIMLLFSSVGSRCQGGHSGSALLRSRRSIGIP